MRLQQQYLVEPLSFSGTGSVGGLHIGVLIIGLISNGLKLNACQLLLAVCISGIIITSAVYVDMVKNRKQNTTRSNHINSKRD